MSGRQGGRWLAVTESESERSLQGKPGGESNEINRKIVMHCVAMRKPPGGGGGVENATANRYSSILVSYGSIVQHASRRPTTSTSQCPIHGRHCNPSHTARPPRHSNGSDWCAESSQLLAQIVSKMNASSSPINTHTHIFTLTHTHKPIWTEKQTNKQNI